MRYEILLDNQIIDEIDDDENVALIKYEEVLNDVNGEEVYDMIELVRLESVKKDDLTIKKDEAK